MKLQKLHIYGFGKHENLQIELHDGVNVFLGDNEAGKSTIQQFILHILFGFPQRNSQLLRYEPRSGATYGGKIILLDADGQKVEVERVRGKASGDVTLYYPNGTRGGERELQQLLNGFSRQDMEAIYSFTLFQLQGLENMTEEELTRTLISSGTTGVDTLANVEALFAKEMGTLFKPSGKKPAINQKLEKIRELEQEWQEYLIRSNEFGPSLERLQQLEEMLANITKEQEVLQEKLQQFYRWRQLQPLIEKEVILTEELQSLQDQRFPVEGIRRYELLKDKKTSCQASLMQLERELDILQHNQGTMSAENLEELHAFLNFESEWHQLRARRIQLEEEHHKLLQQQMKQLALIGIDWENSLEFILHADVSIKQEDILASILKELEDQEAALLQEKRIYEMKEKELVEKEKLLQDTKQATSKSTGKQTSKVFYFMVSVVLLVGFLFSYLIENWMVLALSIILAALLLGSSKFIGKANDLDNYEALMKKEIKTIQEQLQQLEETIQGMQQRIEKGKKQLNQFLESYQMPTNISPSLLPDIFTRLRSIQEQQLQLDFLEGQLEHATKELQKMSTKAANLTTIPLMDDMLFHQLREYYLSAKKQREEQDSNLQKQSDNKKKIIELKSILASYEQQIHELWQEAGVDTENDYYAASKRFQQKNNLEQELGQIQLQLKKEKPFSEPFTDATEKELKEGIQTCERQRNAYLEEKSALQVKTEQLLSDEGQGVLLQRIEEEKSELQELVKKWAVYKAAVTSIKQMMTQLREERLPTVLEEAKNLFCRLTNGSYEGLELVSERGFEAVKANGDRFDVSELSQATKEQAYLALRFSLAMSQRESTGFPIIMDDPFVHFDRNRLKQVVQLVEELQLGHQVLYFTCHEHMANRWRDANMIHVAGLRV